MKFKMHVMKLWNYLTSKLSVFFPIMDQVLAWLRKYKNFYFLLGFFAPEKKYPETEKKYRYGIIICARNEHLVIGNLIDSIYAQTYDQDKMDIFVVADNCTDDTAQICRDKGCIVYERFDQVHARKGYAMEFLFDRIIEDYGIDSYDGYIVFDADNLLNPTFVEELNKAFDTGAGVAVGYRNTKNFDRNVISAGYGIHFYQSVVAYHRPRAWLGISTHIAGTGFVIASRLLKDGWHYTCLTEDSQLTLNCAAQGERIAYCEAAEFFDEQPYEIKVMMRQRIRWIRGRLYSFFSTLPKTTKGLFSIFGKQSLIVEEEEGKRKNIFLRGWRKTLSCYDMIVYAFPNSTYYGLRIILFPILAKIIGVILALFVGEKMGVGDGAGASKPVWMTAWVMLTTHWFTIVKTELSGFLIILRERKRIRCSKLKLFFYTLVFPWFDAIGAPLAIIALFSKSQWKPIKHDEALTLEDLDIHTKKEN
ncbi:MAG: glycosyltransferase family 2 protein [Eubacterium sp.]|nr:glycosyltransferase family 2 protein [Eubacterium sp.]